MAKEGIKEIEVQPRRKILFINMTPRGNSWNAIASGMFGGVTRELEDMPEVILTHLNSDEKLDSGSLEQSKSASLELPESLEGIRAVVINGSPFTSVLLKRGRKTLGVPEDGKA